MATEASGSVAPAQWRPSASSSQRRPLTPPTNLLQTLQVENYRLQFLKECRYLKRPPQSLRLSGANGLSKMKSILLISEFESTILDNAIKEKEDTIREIQDDLNNLNVHLTSLTTKQKKKYHQHFQQKINFQLSKEDSNWKDWPSKAKQKHYAGYRNSRTAKMKEKENSTL